ncbi:ABC transporter ATP-binding protein, partial [Streptomyces sp. SID5473]|nr:ABC transporter ATP-binding protein [Streptomyces tsukubensis NRRL18488]MYS63377.1 ABC transporter ATP-binding protein [Streptomyces sp. SID5473]
HRLSSARRAARVLVMYGTRTEEGTPDELLTRSALFRELTGRWAPPQAPEAPPGQADQADQAVRSSR